MPFSGTFQSLNKNDNLVLSNVLDDISFTSGQFMPTYGNLVRSLWVKPNDGRKLWLGVLGSSSVMYYHTSSVAWDASSFSWAGSGWNSGAYYQEDFSMSPDGVFSLATTEDGTYGGIIRTTNTINNEPSGDSIKEYSFTNQVINTDAFHAICGYYDDGDKALCISNDGEAVTVALETSTTLNVINKIYIQNLHPAAEKCEGCVILYDGQKLLTISERNEQLHEFNYGTPYDISTLTYVKSVALNSDVSGMTTVQDLSALWTDRDDPYTSGIWIISKNSSYKKLVKLNVNGSKYVPV